MCEVIAITYVSFPQRFPRKLKFQFLLKKYFAPARIMVKKYCSCI